LIEIQKIIRNNQGTVGGNPMIQKDRSGYILAAGIGAVLGGVILAVVTKAIPKMMADMMSNMMARMSAEGCSPSEI
jgi:hypothetical protein